MKKLILSVCVAALTSCVCYTKMSHNIGSVGIESSSTTLSLNNGVVATDIIISIPSNYFDSEAIVRMTPVLIYQGGEVAAEPIILQGEGIQENFKPVEFASATTLREHVEFRYRPEMRRSRLQLRIEALCGCSNCDEYTLFDPNTNSEITMSEIETLSRDRNSDESQIILRRCGVDVADGVNTLQSDLKFSDMMLELCSDMGRDEISERSDELLLTLATAKRYMDLSAEEHIYISSELKVDDKMRVTLLNFASKKFNSSVAYNNLGVAYSKMGKTIEASEAFKEALKWCRDEEKDLIIYHNIALMYLDEGDIDSATIYVKESRDDVTRGALAAAKGNYVDAIKVMSGYNAAIVYTQLENYSAAKAALKGDERVNSAEGEYLMAIIASLSGDLEVANESLTKAIKMDKRLAKRAGSDVMLINILNSSPY